MEKQNLYIVRDIISNTTLSISIAPTDGAFMRDVLPSVLQSRRMDDIEYCQVGFYDLSTFSVEPCPLRVCPKDAYKFPETTTRKLTKDEIIALAKQLENVEENK